MINYERIIYTHPTINTDLIHYDLWINNSWSQYSIQELDFNSNGSLKSHKIFGNGMPILDTAFYETFTYNNQSQRENYIVRLYYSGLISSKKSHTLQYDANGNIAKGTFFDLLNNPQTSIIDTGYYAEGEIYSYPYHYYIVSDSSNSFLSSINNIQFRCNIYPNPAKDFLFIKTPVQGETTLISIFSIEGKMVMRDFLQNDKNRIDISSLKKGIYVVKIESANSTSNFKLIKQ